MRQLFAVLLAVAAGGWCAAARGDEGVRIATFQIDATPPLGSPLCDALVPAGTEVVDPLAARGIVLLSAQEPIVLCAVDWVGIGNGGYDTWRSALAKAAGTTANRVAVHTLHQHDAPGCDFEAEELLASRGLSGTMFHVVFARQTIERAADALRESMKNARPVTHLGLGRGRVREVASNRRVLGDDGKVKFVRYSSCKDPAVRAEPEGVIDPDVRLIAFYDGDRPLVSLTYYATHPQSYYGRGGVSADFVGMARKWREDAVPQVAHIHFNGAGGNVAAGKYNDGSPENRPALAERLAEGMKAAWEAVEKTPLDPSQIEWRTRGVLLPASPLLDEEKLIGTLDNSAAGTTERIRAARDLVWLRRVKAARPIEVTCLRLGPAYVLHLPGELFVEYQLAAAEMRPEALVAMAAYGDYGPGYIGTTIAYSQGGYETGPVSRVAPEVEPVLLDALRELLK
ncbi:MAG: hypothetical protein WD229_11220 [Pirellulales bacterium]